MRPVQLDNHGLTLHVAEDGDPDAPPVVILHGITQSTETWNWLVDDLAGTHRVLRLDFRGHGLSDRAAAYDSFDGYVSDAATVCRHAGRPCVVIGHSLGGGTALALAQRHPDLVAAVCCEDPALAAAGPQLEGNVLLDAFRLIRDAAADLQASGISVDDLALAQRDTPSMAGPTFGELLHPDAIRAMAHGLLHLDPKVLDPVVEGRMTAPLDLGVSVDRPGMVVAADPDSPDCVARPELLAPLTAASPAIEARTVAGAGHLIHDSLDHRDTFRALALAVVAKYA